MAKKINIIANLVDKQLKKQLADIEKGKYKIDVDVNSEKINSTNNGMKQLGNTTASTNNEFGKLKNTISNTFSTGKIAMTAYLMVLNEINKAGQNAKQTIKELDKEITDLSVATNMSRESVSALLKTYNDYAKNLKSTTVDVSKAADDYIRAGVSMRDSQELIKDSIMLSKLGQIEANEATKDLLATMNGLNMSVDDVGKALDAMVAVDMEAATSAGDIATALKYCASSADVAGVSFNKLTAMISGVQDKTQQSAETIGTFMNTLLSRYRNVKIGQFVDDDGEDLSEVETILGSLNIQLRDSSQEFRNFETVIDEVAVHWNDYSSVQQAAIAKAFSGTRQQNRFIALMEGYNKVLDLTKVAADSAGTAVEKFNNSYINSLEAKQNALQASFESMIMNSDFSEVYSGIIDATTALVEFIDKTNALKGIMSSLAVGGAIKAFVGIKSGITQAYVTLNKFQNAMNIVGKAKISTKEFDKLLLLSNGLSKSQMKLIVSTNALSVSQKKELLIASGLSEEESILALNTWKMTAANNGLKASTTSVGKSISALWTLIKENPLGLIITGIGLGVSAWQKYKQSIEDAVSSANEAASAYKEQTSSIDEMVSKYQDLRKQLVAAKGNEEETYNVKQQLLELQTELNDTFSDEYGKLNLVTDAYKDQTEAIKEFNKESANKFLNKNRTGIEEATKQMDKDNTYSLGSMNGLVNADEVELLEKIQNIASSYGIEFTERGFEYTGGAREASETIDKFMDDIKELQKQSGDTSDIMSGIFDGLLDNAGVALSKADSIVEKYSEIYDQAKMAQIASDTELSNGYNEAVSAVEAYNEAILQSEDPYNDENVKKAWDNLQTVKQGIQENEEEWGQYSNIVDNVFDSANDNIYAFYNAMQNDNSISKLADDLKGLSDTDLQSMADDGNNGDAFDKLCESAEDYGLAVQDVIDLLVELGIVQGKISDATDTEQPAQWDYSETISQLGTIKSKVDVLDKAYAKLYDKDSQIGFEDFSSINEAFKDLDGIDTYIQRLQEAGQNTEAVTEVMSDLVGAYINQTGILDNVNEKNATLIEQTLTEIGLENSHEVVTKSLALKTDYLAISKEFAASKSKDLADATWEDVSAFMNEQQYSDETRVKLAELALAKITCNGTVLDFSGDISNLIGYIKVLGGATNALTALNNAKSGKSFMYGGKENADALIKQAEQEVQDALDSASNYSFKANYGGGSATNSAKDKASKGSKEKEKKETKQDFDFVERKLDNLSKKTEDLGDAFEDAYSIDDKDKAYINYLSAIQEEIDANNTAIDFYQQKLNEIGLSYEWIAKIQQGAFDISTITDENLINQIQQYQSIYEKILGLQDNVQSLERQRQKAEADHAKDVVDTYEKEIEAFQKVIDKRKAIVDLKETFGLSASEKDLKAEQDAYGKQINRIEEQNRGLIELMKTTTYGSQAWQIYNDKLEDNRNSVADLVQSLADLATEIANLPLDKLDKYLDKHSETNELYDAKIENATSAKSKNKLINKQISLTKKDNNKTKATAKETKKNLSDSIKGFKTAKNTDKKYAPSDQHTKIDSYYKKIQSYTKSKKQIPSSLISQLAEEGHSNLAQAATNYNAALVANETAQATAKLTAETTKTQLAEKTKAKFDNYQTEYERKQSKISHNANMWSSKMDLSQAKGYLDSEIWYNQLIAYEQKNQASLKSEANKLQKQLDAAVANGSIKKNSDEWWDMVDSINAVNEAFEKGKVTLQEYKNQLDQIKFDNFQYLQEQISRITSEADFYINLMSNKDLTDDNGLTDYGLATLGLHYQNYDTLLAQAQKYGDEISKINADLANHPYNTTLITQLQEYEDAQRNCILAAEEEKNAVIELKKQGYDALIDSLSDVIDKYKEFIRNAKDAYDYQNNISEQSDNISSLQKKIAAYSSMSGNEEIASKIQQTQKDLTKAQKDLEETMYEKYVSDTEDMLDDLLQELEEFTNELYNNLSEEFEASRQLAEDNANTINDTLIGLSSSYGVALSSAIQSVWGNGYTPEKGVQTITDKIDELIDASNASADKEADANVYNNVKDSYDKGLSGYESRVSTAQSSLYNAVANQNSISTKLNDAKLKQKELKAERDAIGKKYGKDSLQYINANNAYQEAKKQVDKLNQKLQQAKQNTSDVQKELNDAKNTYNTALASNHNVVQDFLSKIVNSTSSKSEDQMTELDKVIKQIAGGYIEDYNIKQLADLLGTSTNEQEILEMLKKLGFISTQSSTGDAPLPGAFKSGGIATVDSGTLKKTGEDGWVLARNGEGFVSPENVQDIRNLMSVVPDMTKLINVSVPDYSNLIASRNVGAGDVNITFGDLTLPDVTNSAEFASSVKGIMRDAMCNDNKTIKCMTEVVSSQQLGKGIGKARLYI